MPSPKINDIFTHHFTFTEEQILAYAQISGDVNPIHISEDYAGGTIFKKRIVHGYFTISVFSKVYGTLLYPQEHILISQSATYVKPIYTGVAYKAVFTVIDINPDKNRATYLNEIFDAATGELKVTGEATLMNKTHYNWNKSE